MGGASDCFPNCDDCFGRSIATLRGLLSQIDFDEGGRFYIRDKSVPQRYTHPPRPRRGLFLGYTKRRSGQGFRSAWNLTDEQGKDIGFSYLSGNVIGRNRSVVEKSPSPTYDHKTTGKFGHLVTVIDVCEVNDFTPEEQIVIREALLRLFHVPV